MVLYYVHDPMCSWCWAFRPTLAALLQALPAGIEPRKLLGGLAADSDQPMPAAMQQRIQATWRQIEQSVPGTRFNFDFWTRCAPRRSTYPACRAVILAEHAGLGEAMNRLIQEAYYLQARNPSDKATLVELALELGLDGPRFAAELDADDTQRELEQQIAHSRALDVSSYPSLVLVSDDGHWPIAIDYTHPAEMLATIAALSEE